MNVAAGGNDWCQVFTHGVLDKGINRISECVGCVVELQHDALIEMPKEDMVAYDNPYAALPQTDGQWTHIMHDEVAHMLLYKRRVACVEVHVLDYMFHNGSTDHLAIVGHRLFQCILPTVGDKKTHKAPTPKDPKPGRSSFGARFSSTTKTDNADVKSAKPATRKPRPVDKKCSLEECAESALGLGAGVLADMFQAEADDIAYAGHDDDGEKPPEPEPNESDGEACNDDDHDMDIAAMTLAEIKTTFSIDIVHSPVPYPTWTILRLPHKREIGKIQQFNEDSRSLKATCGLRHKPPVQPDKTRKACSCWITARLDSEMTRSFNDLVIWLAEGIDGPAHSNGHWDASQLLSGRYHTKRTGATLKATMTKCGAKK